MAEHKTPEQIVAEAEANTLLAQAKKEIADRTGEANKILAAEIELYEKIVEQGAIMMANNAALEEGDIKRIAAASKKIDALKKEQEAQSKSNKVHEKASKVYDELYKRVIDVAMAYDTQRAALAKLFPATSKYNAELAKVMSTGGEARLTFTEAAAGFQDLAKNFIGFSEVSSETRANLAKLAGGFKAMDIPNFSENVNLAVFSMGMTGKAAGQLQLDLVGTEKALQLPAGTIMKEFLPAMKTLTQYTSTEAIKVFKNLAAQSKATGIAIGDLMGIVGQFDTFDSAAEAAGRFNAMLGGDYLNSIQLLNATEDERIQLIKQSFALSGRQFSDLTRFEKRAVAASLGLKDIAQAQALLGSESENLRLLEERAKKAGMTVEEFTKAQEASKTINEKLNVLYQRFIPIFSGVVDFLNKGIAAVTKAADSFSNFGKMIGGAIFVVGKFLGSMALLKFGLAKLGVGKLLGGLFGGTFAAMGSILVVVAKGIAVAAVLLAGVGIAFMAAGAGISAFALSMKQIQELDAAKISSNMLQMGKAAALTAPVAAAGGLVTGALGLIGGAIGGATRALTGAGTGQQINLTITHNDVGKTDASIQDAFTNMGMRIGRVEKVVRNVQAAKSG